MVAKKISELTQISTLAVNDVLPITDMSAGTDGTKTVSIGDFDSRYLWGQSEAEAAAGVTPSDKQYPLGNVKRYGAVGDGIVNDTQAIVDAMESNAGGTVIFPEGNYAIEHVTPLSNTTIWMDGGVTITRISQKTFALQIANVSDVHFYCNGATIDGSIASTLSTHTVNFVGATRCTVRDAYIKGAGQDGKDGVYFGQGLTDSSYDCGIIGGRIDASLRNGASFVSAVRCFLDGVEISNVVGSPGFGVDVEANSHDEFCIHNIIRNCDVHDNQNSGIGIVFGDQTLIENNKCYDNGDDGIRISSGGNTRNDDRPNVDVMGISAFDQANGWITVGGDLNLLPIGMGVSPDAKNGETLPGGLTEQGYVVTEHNGSAQIRVGTAADEDSIESFSSAESGTGNSDPSLSDYVLNVLGGDGQSSKTKVIGNVCYDNGQTGIVATSCDHLVVDKNRCYNNTQRQMSFTGCYQVTITNNQCYTDTAVNFDGASISRCHFAYIANNKFYNIGYVGLNITGGSYSKVIGNVANNCGENGSGITSANFRLDTNAGVVFSGNSGRNAESYGATSYGLLTGDLTGCHFTDNIFRLAGPDNTNSIVIIESSHFYSNNVKYDGTLYVYS